jgi:Tol biopolymer transport system component
MVMDLGFSPDGRRLAATAKHDGHWTLLVDDRLWRQRFDQVRPPVFSPDGRLVAVVVESGGRFGLAVDDRRLPQSYEALWQPVFSPDGTRVLVRGIEKGTYRRQVLAVDQLLA